MAASEAVSVMPTIVDKQELPPVVNEGQAREMESLPLDLKSIPAKVVQREPPIKRTACSQDGGRVGKNQYGEFEAAVHAEPPPFKKPKAE